MLPVAVARADMLGGALGGALFGGLIGGGDGAAIGALVGGVAGAAREDARRRRYEDASRARYEQQRLDWERQRMEQERQLHAQRMQTQQAQQPRATGLPAPPAATASAPAAGGGNLVADLQRSLIVLGYEPGPVDGDMGPATVTAIKRYQTDMGLNPTGHATPELLAHIRAAGG
jgi:hypothetical protein